MFQKASKLVYVYLWSTYADKCTYIYTGMRTYYLHICDPPQSDHELQLM